MATGQNLIPALKNELRAVRTALWVRPAAYCLAAAAASAMLALVEALLPQGSLRWLPPVEVGTAIETLKLLATGMMTVATVTLSVLMLVLSMAAGQFSPRAVPELMADPVTQNALGTFLATFVYALAALLLFGFEVVTGRGVTLVFIAGLLLAVNALRFFYERVVGWDRATFARDLPRRLTIAPCIASTSAIPGGRRRAEPMQPLCMKVNDFVLVDSRPGPSGSLYSVIARWPLLS